jgi:hypothetical protein
VPAATLAKALGVHVMAVRRAPTGLSNTSPKTAA